jgi:hypothetical protein
LLSFFGVGPRLVDGYHGRYEFSFTGSEVRRLVFVDQVWSPFLFFGGSEDQPPLVEIPQSFESNDGHGTSVSLKDNRYLVTFDLDERSRFYNEFGSPGTNFDPALPSICGVGTDQTNQTNCSLDWAFSIDNGGWLDDIKLNFLGAGEDGIPVPEPGTLALLLTGLITAGAFTFRGKTAM